MAAGVSQQLAEPLYGERRLRELVEGVGDAGAGIGGAAVLCGAASAARTRQARTGSGWTVFGNLRARKCSGR